MRFRRVGARKFLRFPQQEKLVFGDCGAFSYVKCQTPPYGPEDTVEFYAAGEFTHGCSIDHIIFEFDTNVSGMEGGTNESRERYKATLQLATEFYRESKILSENFTPIGVIQGWSPDSMADAAKNLVKMGYRYLALGGLVPLKTPQIHQAVSTVQDAISQWANVRLHLLGFAKADNLHEFTKYDRIASFDSSSPLIRAFKDNKYNYYLPNSSRGLEYYTAIRIPQATVNRRLTNHVKKGYFPQEELIRMEKDALEAMRSFANGGALLEETVECLIKYSRPMYWTASISKDALTRKLDTIRRLYTRTLEAKPWQKCKCQICASAGVEVILFRGSNRNKRRGIHNLHVYYNHLQRINGR